AEAVGAGGAALGRRADSAGGPSGAQRLRERRGGPAEPPDGRRGPPQDATHRVHRQLLLRTGADEQRRPGAEPIVPSAGNEEVLPDLAGEPRGPVRVRQPDLAEAGTGRRPLEYGEDENVCPDLGGRIGRVGEGRHVVPSVEDGAEV